MLDEWGLPAANCGRQDRDGVRLIPMSEIADRALRSVRGEAVEPLSELAKVRDGGAVAETDCDDEDTQPTPAPLRELGQKGEQPSNTKLVATSVLLSAPAEVLIPQSGGAGTATTVAPRTFAEREADLRARVRALDALKALPEVVGAVALLGSDGQVDVTLAGEDAEWFTAALRQRRELLEATAFGGMP
jgi:hypothetical protein